MCNIVPKIFVGMTCNYFDDGKISPSRMESVVITEIIPFSSAPENIINLWERMKSDCDWVYADITDFFIKAVIPSNSKELIFAREKNGEWFGFNDYWYDGLLDETGKYTELLKQYNNAM